MEREKIYAQECVKLTLREKEILKLIYYGKTNKEIAQILHLSVHTIKFYITSIFKKLKVDYRIQAVVKAMGENLIE